ncbi:MAG: hypothetical protein H0V44_02380 [Planctomycetes bacterium]|nr:hypothetical protein [Planctomycetota bacterium]
MLRILRMLVILVWVVIAGSAADEVVKHPDGSLKSRYPVDKHRLRHGTYIEYHPGGKKKVAAKAAYRSGSLNGVCQRFDLAGALIADETWVEGRLVFPRSIGFIDGMRQRIAAEAAGHVAKAPGSGNPRAPKPEDTAKALAKLRFYRFLCGVPWDVGIDPALTDCSQHGADFLAKLGRLEWNPTKPADMSDEAFTLAAKGCSQTNQCAGKTLVESIDAMMDDSDPQNIDRLLHRRKMLDPKMRITGFGEANQFVTMYAHDKTRPQAVEFSFISFPPPGYCPIDLITPTTAWHISFNPEHYDLIDAAVPMDIYTVDASLTRSARPLDLDFRHVGFDDFGIPGAVVVRPKDLKLVKGSLYEVVVSGLKPKPGHPASVSYIVSFY